VGTPKKDNYLLTSELSKEPAPEFSGRTAHGDLLNQSAIALIIVSVGEDAELLARGLRSPFILDETANIRIAFRASGTPMAIRIDAKGNVASEIAAGKDAVITLLQRTGRRQVLPVSRKTSVPLEEADDDIRGAAVLSNSASP
jgi:hypothetical protein